MSRVWSKPLLALASVATLASCGGSSGSLEPRFVAVHNTLTSMGFAQTGSISQGSLSEGEEIRIPVELAAGACYSVVALGGRGVDDLGLRVVDARNESIAEDRTTDRQAAAQACPTRAGAHEIVVSMVAGSGDFTVSTWQGGARGAAGASVGAVQSGASACASAEDITPGRLVHGTTAGGSATMTAPCTGGTAPERVYRFTVDRTSQVTVGVESAYDAVVYVLAACGQTDSALACNDDHQDVNQARVSLTVEAGTYFVVVDGYGTASGEFDLSLDVQPLRPVAEICADAPVLTPGQPLSASTAHNPNYFQATCAGGATGADRVFRLPVAQRSRVRLRQRSQFDGALHVRRACAEPASELACNDDAGSTVQSLITGVYDEGEYFVVSDGYGESQGDFTLEADIAPVAGGGAASDRCGDAERLTVGARREVDTFLAADDLAGSCGGAGAADVVYRVDVASPSNLRVVMSGVEFPGFVYVRRACADEGAEVACAPFAAAAVAPPGQPTLEVAVERGIYYVVVDGVDANSFGAAAMQVELIDMAALERECRRAPVLQPGRTVNGTTAGLPSRFEASCAGNARSGDAVYRLVVRRRQRVVVDLTSSYDAALHLRASCTDRSSERACNDDTGSQTASQVTVDLDPGTYYVIVDGFGDTNTGTYSLTYQATNL